MSNPSKDPNAIWREQMKKRLNDAVLQAQPLLAERRLDELETRVRAVESDIYGMLALGKMYREHLADLVRCGEIDRDRAHVEAIFSRALQWAQRAYPEPHTQFEADDYEAARKEVRADLIKILGDEPRDS